MSGLLVIHSSEKIDQKVATSLCQSLDLGNHYDVQRVDIDRGFLATAFRYNEPLGGPRTFESERWVVNFAGDLIDHQSVPYETIVSALVNGKYDVFESFNGIFVLTAYDKENMLVYAITDRRSQKPLYYFFNEKTVCIATGLASFCRLGRDIQFNGTWLWQTLFFNFPIDATTFLDDVYRVPAASVLVYDCRIGQLNLAEYARPFERREPLLRGQEALEQASAVFAARTSRYFDGSDEIACALTGGWDGRTMLALAPAGRNITSYTYGCPGCGDISRAEVTARLVGIEHLTIPFDDKFVHEIPRHALESVYLSSGLQGILRSSLNYAYKQLTNDGKRFPLTISGISLDMQFRGHVHSPSLVSQQLARGFQGYNDPIATEYWQAIVGQHFESFRNDVKNGLAYLRNHFGPFDDSKTHLSYVVYPLSTSHFAGELAISDHYTTVRVPSWDAHIIDMAYSIEQSTLSFSQFLRTHKRGSRKEMMLQAFIFKQFAPHFYDIPVGGRRPADILAGDVRYNTYRLYNGILNRIRRYLSGDREAPLENWESWLFDFHEEFIGAILLSGETLLVSYIEPSFIREAIATRNTRFIGKLISSEIILRLIKNKWQRFWD